MGFSFCILENVFLDLIAVKCLISCAVLESEMAIGSVWTASGQF
jgi:hypothetical protein